MPLIIDGIQVEDAYKCSSTNIFKRFEGMKTRSVDFIKNEASNKRRLCSDEGEGERDRLLYVGQREYAVTSGFLNPGDFDWVASDDATTCHILILKEPYTRTVGLMHIDGFRDTEADIKEMISKMVHCASLSDVGFSVHTLDMFLFGGFLDTKCYSEPISSKVFEIAKNSSYNIHLKLACCCLVNDSRIADRHQQEKHEPIVTGVGVNLRDPELEIKIVTCVYQGPDMLLRNARLSHIDENSCIDGTGQQNDTCWNVFDYEKGCVSIKPFAIAKPRYGAELLRLPDAQLLQCCSTSPHCEPPHFVDRLKDTLRFALKYHNQLAGIFDGKARRWKLNSECQWCLMDDIHRDIHL